MKSVSVAFFAAIIGCVFVQPVSAAEAAKFTEQVLHSFAGGTDGRAPRAGLINARGTLYGTTLEGGGAGCHHYGCGTVFSIDPNTGAEKVLYSFCRLRNCADGAEPYAGLIDVKGRLYGTTQGGGTYGYGTMFALDPSNGSETVLYAFCSQPKCADGAVPNATLIAWKGAFYGTTFIGGSGCSCGTVFSFDPGNGAEEVLYSFCSQNNCGDGTDPWASVVDVKGMLYGTASSEGLCAACGTVFSINPNSDDETTLYSFCARENCADGSGPVAALIDVNGHLYGTTEGGGITGCLGYGCGSVFSLDPRTGTEKVLYSFCHLQGCPDGAFPQAGLTDLMGTLYGATSYGDRTGCRQTGACATVFSIDPGSGTEKTLYTFCRQQNCTDGADPAAGLTVVNSSLYGTTSAGGAYGFGTVFVLKKYREARVRFDRRSAIATPARG